MEFINSFISSNDVAIDVSQKGGDNHVTLELGDIIEIVSPSNDELHEMTFLITYIDSQKIVILNVSTGNTYELNSTEQGGFSDESIIGIHILNRSEEKGYARQNNLLPKTWVDITLEEKFPSLLLAKYTDLEEVTIVITSYPEIMNI